MTALVSQRSLGTLMVASLVDVASLNIANSFLENYKSEWKELDTNLWRSKDILLWVQEDPLLRLDNPDQIVMKKYSPILTDINFDEVVFLSKHVAASGKPSLTVHPIGIPWQTESSRSGGIPGRCSPPNLRIASIYRRLLEETKSKGLADTFEVTLEATHHGPFVSLPTCFVEIGSTEKDWGIPLAGVVWADCLAKVFGIPQSSLVGSSGDRSHSDCVSALPVADTSKYLVLCIGGGHYCPKLNDAARLGDHISTGHCLATYTLESHLDGSVENPVPGGWRAIIDESIQSCRLAGPDHTLICLVDKKAFKGEHRQAITAYLDELNVRWTLKSTDLKAL